MTSILPIFQLGDIKTREENGEISQLRITTGTNDRAISTIARNLAGHYQAFNSYGTEGSYAVWNELADGTYEITWDIYTAESNPEEDAFFYWNGYELEEVGDRSFATNPNSIGSRWTSDVISTQVEVRGGEMTFVALDQGDKTGSSEMRISSIELVEEKPATDIFAPTTELGMIRQDDDWIRATTGGDSVAMSTISRELTGDRNVLTDGVEGSLLQWGNLENGTYEIIWRIDTWDSTYSDLVGYYDPETQQIIEFEMPPVTNEDSNYLWETDWQIAEIEVTDGELSLVALDVGTNLSSTELFVRSINQISTAPLGIEFDVEPSDGIGNYTINGEVGTGSGAASSSQMSQDFFHGFVDLTQYGTEGGTALWVTEPGVNRITYEITTTEPNIDRDQFLLWDGQELFQLADRSIAITSDGQGGYTSGDITVEVNTVSDEWGIVALDMGDTVGDSTLRVVGLEWLPDAPVPDPLPEPELEPPEQSPNPVGWGDVTGQARFIQGEFLGEFGQWHDPADGYAFYLDEASIVRFEVQETAGVGVDFEVLYEGELVSDGEITGDTIEVPLEAGESELRLYMSNPFTSVEYDLQFEAIAIPPDVQNLGTFDDSQFAIANENIGGSDTQDIYQFEVTQPNITNLNLAADANVNLQIWQDGEKLFERVKENAQYDFDLAPGVYELRVGSETLATGYDLTLSNVTRPLFAQEESSDRKLIGTPDSSFTNFEFIGSNSTYSDPLDSYQFWVDETQDYTIAVNTELTGLNGFVILNKNGLPIGGFQIDSAFWDSNGFEETYSLEPGHYSLIVADNQGGGQ